MAEDGLSAWTAMLKGNKGFLYSRGVLGGEVAFVPPLPPVLLLPPHLFYLLLPWSACCLSLSLFLFLTSPSTSFPLLCVSFLSPTFCISSFQQKDLRFLWCSGHRSLAQLQTQHFDLQDIPPVMELGKESTCSSVPGLPKGNEVSWECGKEGWTQGNNTV